MENNKVFINRKIENKKFLMSSVEIIVPFCVDQSIVVRLMEGIFNTVQTNRYLISLIDDCSDNQNFIKDIDKAKIAGVRCFRNEERKGFGASVNEVLSKPKKNVDIPWVLVLDPHVYFEKSNWLFNLGVSLNDLKSDGVKMVSPMIKNIDHEILKVKESEVDFVLPPEEHLPIFCVLAHRELFKRVGYFDESLHEKKSESFSKKMKSLGYKQAVCRKSFISI